MFPIFHKKHSKSTASEKVPMIPLLVLFAYICWHVSFCCSVHRLQCGQLCQCAQTWAMWRQMTALLLSPHLSPCLRHDILLSITADVRPPGPQFLGILLPLCPPSPGGFRTGVSEVCYLIWIWISASSTEPSSQPHLTVFITTASSAVWSHSSFWFSYPWTAKNYLCWILFKTSFGHFHISIEKVSLDFLSSMLFLLINFLVMELYEPSCILGAKPLPVCDILDASFWSTACLFISLIWLFSP